MSNMSYCRFRNTLEDLLDCWQHIDDDDLDAEEERARDKLIQLCANIADEAPDEEE